MSPKNQTSSTSLPSTSHNKTIPPSPPSQDKKLKTIPPLVLLSFVVLHSQVYWLYSVIYHICHQIPDRSLDFSLDDSILHTLQSGRARALSEPKHSSSSNMIEHHQNITTTTTDKQSNQSTTKRRPRSTTISATTVDADSPLRRQQWVQQLYDCIDDEQKKIVEKDENKMNQQQESFTDSYIMDEKLGRTRPPRWWLLTKKHLTRMSQDNENNNDSSLSLPKKLIESINLPSSIPTTTTTSSSSNSSSSTSNNNNNNLTKITNHFTFSSVLPSSNLKSSDLVSQKNKSIEEINHVEPKTLKKIIPMIKSLSTSTTHSSSSMNQENHHTNTLFLKNLTSNPNEQQQNNIIENDDDEEKEIKEIIISSSTSNNHHDIKRKRTLNKIKSVFVKSQIEPELSRQSQQNDLIPKRKTILGIPSRWKHSSIVTTQELLSNNDNHTTTCLTEQSSSNTMENNELETIKIENENLDPIDFNSSQTTSKKRVFHSLPIWKRKSYR